MYSQEFFRTFKKTELKELCRSFKLPVSGTKSILAARLAFKFEDVRPRSAEASKIDQHLDQSINSIDHQIAKLESPINRAELSNLQHDISDLYGKHMATSSDQVRHTQSSPQLSIEGNIMAKSSEPYVTRRRPREAALSDIVQQDASEFGRSSDCTHDLRPPLSVKHDMLSGGMHSSNAVKYAPPLESNCSMKHSMCTKVRDPTGNISPVPDKVHATSSSIPPISPEVTESYLFKKMVLNQLCWGQPI